MLAFLQVLDGEQTLAGFHKTLWAARLNSGWDAGVDLILDLQSFPLGYAALPC